MEHCELCGTGLIVHGDCIQCSNPFARLAASSIVVADRVAVPESIDTGYADAAVSVRLERPAARELAGSVRSR